MKRFRRRLGHPGFVALAGRVVAWLLRILGATWRLRSEGPDPFATGEPFVAALWHQNLLIAAWAFRDRGVVVPVSLSRDGDLIAAVLGHLRYAPPPRGSTSRGSLALVRELVRAARGGQVVGILPDGPRGPAREAQPGVVAVARATGLPLVPMAAAARPAIRFRSWDRALLPLPFARVVRRYGSPIAVPKDLDEAGREAVRVRLARELDELTLDLEQRLGPADAGEPTGRH